MNEKKMLQRVLMMLACSMFASGFASRVRRDQKLKVATIVEPPYTSKKVDNPQTNEDFDGYIPELLKRILGQQINEKYSLYVVADGKYGAKDAATQKWSGMIGDVVDGNADIAASAITVSEARKEVVDFTEMLMAFSPVILLKKPSDGSSLKINSAEALANQTEVKYGVVKDGTTQNLIRNSSDPVYKRLDKSLTNDQQHMVISSQEGVKKVRSMNGKFAFITESATGDYWVRRSPCDLVTIPLHDLPKSQYALAVKRGSPLKDRLNEAIRELRKTGELDKLKAKWWDDQCSSSIQVTLGGWASLLYSVAILRLVLTVSST